MIHPGPNPSPGVIAWMRGERIPAPPPPTPPQPVPHADWPRWALWAEEFAGPGDNGVGDTIQRQLGIVGEAFKASLKMMGVECGCETRRESFNILYPYRGT